MSPALYVEPVRANNPWIEKSREYIASYPHGVFAVRLSANQTGKVDVKVSLSRSQSVLSQTAHAEEGEAGGHSVLLSANSGQTSGAITFWSDARVANSGGECCARYSQI